MILVRGLASRHRWAVTPVLLPFGAHALGQIYLVRHGQASFGAEDYDELSDLGAQQSRLLGGWLARLGQPLTCVVTGSLKRHRQTADACMAAVPASLKSEGH